MPRQDRSVPWILPWSKRRSVSKKFKDTEKEIKQCRLDGDWKRVKRLRYLLRNVWWGIKRYK